MSIVSKYFGVGFGFVTLLVLGAGACFGQAEETQPKTVRVAICQTMGIDSDRPGNLLRMEVALEEAVKQGAKIVCFPESAILGWVNPEAHKLADTVPGKDSDRLAELAKKHKVYICSGISEKEGEKLYDAAVLINPQGEIILKHRKINILTACMTPPYTPGKEVQVAETEFGKIGILICADTFRTSLCERMAKLQPNLMLIPYGWAAKPDRWPGHGKQLQGFAGRAAKITGAPVVGIDLVGAISNGPMRGMTYGGASVAITPDGKVLARTKDRQSDVKVFTIELPRRTASKDKAEKP